MIGFNPMMILGAASGLASSIKPIVELFQGIKGPQAKKREKEQQLAKQKEATLQAVGSLKDGRAGNPNVVANAQGPSLPLPTSPVATPPPVATMAPPQAQLQAQQPQQQQDPLSAQRNQWLMKRMFQG